jgi:uncharacterized protein DUF1801
MAQKTKTVEAYLTALSPEKRRALERLRKVIRAAAPKAEECISYGIPAFRLNGKFLVGLAAAATHCSFYPGAVVKTLRGTQGIRHEQGHDSLPPGQAFAQHAGPEARESPNRKSRNGQKALMRTPHM